MTVGVFEEGRFATDLAQKIAPFLSGQRAVRRDVFQKYRSWKMRATASRSHSPAMQISMVYLLRWCISRICPK